MTRADILELEEKYRKYDYTKAAQKILELINYVRELENERNMRNNDNGGVEPVKRRRKTSEVS